MRSFSFTITLSLQYGHHCPSYETSRLEPTRNVRFKLRRREQVILSEPRVGMSARDDGAVNPSAVTFTATPLPGQEPLTSLITQPTLVIDIAGKAWSGGPAI